MRLLLLAASFAASGCSLIGASIGSTVPRMKSAPSVEAVDVGDHIEVSARAVTWASRMARAGRRVSRSASPST